MPLQLQSSGGGIFSVDAPAGVATNFSVTLPQTTGTIITFASGTKLPFYQTSAPTGWTKDTTAALNDAILRIVTGTGGVTGGTTAFSTFNGQTATAAYTLTTTDIPAHNHGVSDPTHNHSHSDPGHYHTTGTTTYGAGANAGMHHTSAGSTATSSSFTGITNVAAATGITINNSGGGGSHSHGITTSIKYADFLIASKD